MKRVTPRDLVAVVTGLGAIAVISAELPLVWLLLVALCGALLHLVTGPYLKAVPGRSVASPEIAGWFGVLFAAHLFVAGVIVALSWLLRLPLQ